MNALLLLMLVSCGGKSTAPVEKQNAAEPASEKTSAPKKQGLNVQNEALLSTGVLDPIPSEAEGEFTVRYRTLYRNGCWSQSEVETKVDGNAITHSYTTQNDGEGKICTMALKPGGFSKKMDLESGSYTGKIIVDGQEKAGYGIKITGKSK